MCWRCAFCISCAGNRTPRLWVFETGCQLVLSHNSKKGRASTVPSKKKKKKKIVKTYMVFKNDILWMMQKFVESGLVSVCCRPGQGSVCKPPRPYGLIASSFWTNKTILGVRWCAIAHARLKRQGLNFNTQVVLELLIKTIFCIFRSITQELLDLLKF